MNSSLLPRAVIAVGLLLACVTSGCAAGPGLEQVDGGAYESCSDPAWTRARAALSGGDRVGAVRELRTVVDGSPDFVPGHLEWIRVASELGGGPAEAMRAYYSALPDRPSSPVPPFVRAKLETNDHRRVELLDTSVRRDPSFYFAYVELAEIWGRSERTAKQFEFLQKAVQAKPDSPAANLGLARVLVSIGRGEEAVSHFEVYLRAHPDDVASVAEFVQLLIYDLERVDDARPWVDRLRALAPDDVATLMDAAALAWLKGERDRAALDYRRALQLEPTNARAALNLGNLWFLTGNRGDDAGKRADWSRARSAYRYYLTLDAYADVHDLHDHFVSVPYRLGEIDRLLGPLPRDAAPVRVGDL